MVGTTTVDRLIQQIEIKLKGRRQIVLAKKGFTDINKIIDQTEQKVKLAGKEMSAAMLQFGFTALFGGMALKRLGTTIVKSLINTYNKATDEQNIFFQKLQGVSAAFEFLKFSIFDALSQSELVIGLIDGFIQLVNRLSEFVNKHPLVSKIFVAFAIGGIILGTVLTVMGQLALATLGFAAAGTILGSRFVKFGKFFKRLWFVILLPIITNIGRAFKNAFILAGRAIFAFLSNPLVLLVSGFILVIGSIFLLGKAMGGFWEFTKSVFRGLANLAVLLGNALIDQVLAPLKAIISAAISIGNFLVDRGLLSQSTLDRLVAAQSVLLAISQIKEAAVLGAFDKIAETIPQAVSEEDFKANLQSDFDAFKALIGVGEGGQTVALENVQNVEINIETPTNDLEGLTQSIKDAMNQSNRDFLEEQIIRLEGTTRGT